MQQINGALFCSLCARDAILVGTLRYDDRTLPQTCSEICNAEMVSCTTLTVSSPQIISTGLSYFDRVDTFCHHTICYCRLTEASDNNNNYYYYY